jgi:hypothetical protein
MTFDLGGFLGGIVGTIGSFGIAFFSIRHELKQMKPGKLAAKLKVARKANAILWDAFSVVGLEFQGKSAYQVLSAFFDRAIKPLDELSAEAASVSGELYRFITETRAELMKCFQDVMPRNPMEDITWHDTEHIDSKRRVLRLNRDAMPVIQQRIDKLKELIDKYDIDIRELEE